MSTDLTSSPQQALRKPSRPITIIEGPTFAAPFNHLPGLYLVVRSPSGLVTAEELVAAVREAVSAAGYRPSGSRSIGGPCADTHRAMTYAMWFYDRNPR